MTKPDKLYDDLQGKPSYHELERRYYEILRENEIFKAQLAPYEREAELIKRQIDRRNKDTSLCGNETLISNLDTGQTNPEDVLKNLGYTNPSELRKCPACGCVSTYEYGKLNCNNCGNPTKT